MALLTSLLISLMMLIHPWHFQAMRTLAARPARPRRPIHPWRWRYDIGNGALWHYQAPRSRWTAGIRFRVQVFAARLLSQEVNP